MILLTGASGFIGTHLREELANNYGQENIILLTSKPIENFQCIIHQNYNFEKINFPENIDTIVHAGAFIPKKQSQANDIELCNKNIATTFSLLKKLTKHIDKFIFFSTIDVYDAHINEKVNEASAINPVSLYGDSKLYCEKMIENWAKQHDKLIQILRIGHIYGPGEEVYQKIIPITIQNTLQNIEPVIYTSGEEKRSFLYVKDCCRYITKSIELKKYSGPVNVANQEVISILELVNNLIQLATNKNIIPKILNQLQGRNLEFDTSKLYKLLGKPTIKLEDGLSLEIDYMRQLKNGE